MPKRLAAPTLVINRFMTLVINRFMTLVINRFMSVGSGAGSRHGTAPELFPEQ